MDEQAIDMTMNSYGELMFMDNALDTTIITKGKFESINFSNPIAQVFNFSVSAGKLVFTGSGNASYTTRGLVRLAHFGSPETRELKIAIAKNGIVQEYTSVICSGDGLYKSGCVKTDLTLANGDFIEIYITNAQGTEPLKVKDFRFTVSKI